MRVFKRRLSTIVDAWCAPAQPSRCRWRPRSSRRPPARPSPAPVALLHRPCPRRRRRASSTTTTRPTPCWTTATGAPRRQRTVSETNWLVLRPPTTPHGCVIDMSSF